MKYLRVDFSHIKKAYFIGIKGVGMTALADVMHHGLGIRISGSDTAETFFTEKTLKNLHIPYVEGFAARNVPKNTDIVVSSAAYYRKNERPSHPEIIAARKMKIPVYTYPEMLGALFRISRGIAVCGSHGKTTVTALIGHLLSVAKLDPTVIVGSHALNFGSNARVGNISEHGILVAESDEYREAFLNYAPKIIVLTNIDYDHPDYFKTPAAYIRAFEKIVSNLPKNGLLIAFGDDPLVRRVAKKAPCRVVYYGKKHSNDIYFRAAHANDLSQTFDIVGGPSGTLRSVTLPLTGTHNILNTLAAAAIAFHFTLSGNIFKRAVSSFRNTRRRMEVIGKRNGALVIDDYAHHPSEIRATLSGLRAAFPKKKIIAVFQPHTFSRTKVFLKEFSASFSDADNIYICEIYGSARENKGAVSSRDIIEKMAHKNSVHYAASPLDPLNEIRRKLNKNTIVITLGAGDVWRLAKKLAKK
jgi:UDP-N-acetylmuramate--alanine ligase